MCQARRPALILSQDQTLKLKAKDAARLRGAARAPEINTRALWLLRCVELVVRLILDVFPRRCPVQFSKNPGANGVFPARVGARGGRTPLARGQTGDPTGVGCACQPPKPDRVVRGAVARIAGRPRPPRPRRVRDRRAPQVRGPHPTAAEPAPPAPRPDSNRTRNARRTTCGMNGGGGDAAPAAPRPSRPELPAGIRPSAHSSSRSRLERPNP